ncbi:MAG TPA: hypothetical protein VGL86_10185 [Polyangia bacterium]|jgi:hypothetical protein
MAERLHDDGAELAQLLRRAAIVVQHMRYHRQEVDAHDVTERVLAGDGGALARWRGPLTEAIATLMHGLR